MDVNIRVDDQQVRRALGDVQSQAPYAISVAVNSVTKDAQEKIREGYKQRFTLRRPDWVLREGSKITQFAKKAAVELSLARQALISLFSAAQADAARFGAARIH